MESYNVLQVGQTYLIEMLRDENGKIESVEMCSKELGRCTPIFICSTTAVQENSKRGIQVEFKLDFLTSSTNKEEKVMIGVEKLKYYEALHNALTPEDRKKYASLIAKN